MWTFGTDGTKLHYRRHPTGDISRSGNNYLIVARMWVTRDNVGWASLYLAAAYGQFACSSGQRSSIPDTRKVQQRSINGMPGLVQSLLEHGRMGTCTTNMAEPARSSRVNQHAKNKSNNT
jgi:hypothetical protein